MLCAWIWHNRARAEHALSTTATHGASGATPVAAKRANGETTSTASTRRTVLRRAHLGDVEDDLEHALETKRRRCRR